MSDNQLRHNAMHLKMWTQAEIILHDFMLSPEVKVVVIRGPGNQTFIFGADISQFDATRNDAHGAKIYSLIADKVRATMSGFEKPLIAMIHGLCFGAGLDVAMRADTRLVAENSVFLLHD